MDFRIRIQKLTENLIKCGVNEKIKIICAFKYLLMFSTKKKAYFKVEEQRTFRAIITCQTHHENLN